MDDKLARHCFSTNKEAFLWSAGVQRNFITLGHFLAIVRTGSRPGPQRFFAVAIPPFSIFLFRDSMAVFWRSCGVPFISLGCPQVVINLDILPTDVGRLPINICRLPTNFGRLPTNFGRLPTNFSRLPINCPLISAGCPQNTFLKFPLNPHINVYEQICNLKFSGHD